MRSPACVAAIALGSAAILSAQANPFSTAVRYSAQIVFAGAPADEVPLEVEDFRVDDAALSSRGAQHVTLRGDRGAFEVPFSAIQQIELLRFAGLYDGFAEYDARIALADAGGFRSGRLRFRALRGRANGLPWYVLPAARMDRGAGLSKITITGRSAPVAAPLSPPSSKPQ